MTRLLSATAAAGGLAALALAPAAGAATKDVAVGGTVKGQPEAVLSGFYPKQVTVAAGDSVRFKLQGFGVAYLPKKGEAAPSFITMDPSRPVSGAVDAAGVPFAFNGKPTPLVNPKVFLGGKSGSSYTGAATLSQGLPNGPGAPKPFSVKFPKAGSYKVYDGVHPGISMTVKVVAKGKAVPSKKADAARAAKQLAADVKTAKALAAQAAPTGNTIVAGPDKGGVDLFRFSPASKTVKVGTTLNLTMSKGTVENHTFTFGAKDKLAKMAEGFIAPLPGTGTAGPPVLAFDPVQAYESDPGTPAYDGTNHGDGFLNTGVLGGRGGGLAQGKSVTFTKAGTYDFLCLIHPDMQGKVVVAE